MSLPAVGIAGGLVLPGSGSVSTGRAGASVASIDDPSAVAINPARLTAVAGDLTIHVGTMLLDYRMKYQRSGSYEEDPEAEDAWEGTPYPEVDDDSSPAVGIGGFQAVPLIAVSKRLGGKARGLTVAAAIMAPHGYPSRSFESDYELEEEGRPPPPSRYDVLDQEAAIVLPSIAAGYQVNDRLSVGARFSAGFAHVKALTYVWGLPNFTEWVARDAEFSVDVKDNFIPAFGLGAHYRVNDAIEVGAAWNSGFTIDGSGTGTAKLGSANVLSDMQLTVIPPDEAPLCADGGTEESLKACLTVKLPWMANLGGRYVFRGPSGAQVADLELNLDYEAWGGVSDYDVIVDGYIALSGERLMPLQPVVIRHNLQDTVGVRVGGSWQRPLSFGTLVVRGGLAYDTAAAKDGWERVDFDGAARTTGTLGVSLRRDSVQVDVGGGVVYEGSRTQGTGCNPVFGEGCTPGSTPDPITDRPGPDPIQPNVDSRGQLQSPFNEGTYESGYTLLTLGVTTWF